MANYQNDVSWLTDRLSSIVDDAKHLSRSSKLRLLSMAENVEGVNALRHLTEELFSVMDLAKPQWTETPEAAALPMIATLPGIGYRIVYAHSNDGSWMMEGADGSERVVFLPEGGNYARIIKMGSEDESSVAIYPTALAMFKRIFFRNPAWIVQAIIASTLVSILALATSLYSMQVYDRVIASGAVSTLMVLTIGVSITIILELILKLARSVIIHNSVAKIDYELSSLLCQRLLGIRMDQFPSSIGSLSAQIRSYDSIRQFMQTLIMFLAADAPFGLFFLLIIYLLGGAMVASVPFIFAIICVVIGISYRKKIEQHTKQSFSVSIRKTGLLVEIVGAAEAIKASGSGWQVQNVWNDISHRAVEEDKVTRELTETVSYMSASLQQISYVLLVCAGAYIAATSQSITQGAIIACSILSSRVLAPIAAIPNLIVQWANSKMALQALEKMFALQRDNHEVKQPLAPTDTKGNFTMDAVQFNYPGRTKGLSIPQLNIEAGEKIAILGVVGSGKSTLLKLLAGVYKAQKGRILIDGVDIQHISRHMLSERLGYLPQQINLIGGTLRSNLTAGVVGVSDEFILKIAEMTTLKNIAMQHEKGMDLPITEGGHGLSGGQKQLVVLTRLIISRPDVWLLDEPTSSMDESTESRCVQVLKELIKPEQTLVLVTHKPVMLALVDRIIVLTPAGIALDGPRDKVIEELRSASTRTQKTQ